jgi:MinD superfamily P-loop ATPase
VKIAFASGKGGTGKTTVAVNVAYILQQCGADVQLLDCDVEEPNAHLFLQPRIDRSIPATVKRPEAAEDRCTGCGVCAEYCEFNAITVFKSTVIIFPELCHGCGVCAWFCPERIITETDRPIGVIEGGMAKGIRFLQGRLNIGEVMAPPMIRQVKEQAQAAAVTLIDCPPGNSCPLIEAVRDTDLVILVSEPTPFGLYDLSLTVASLKELGLPAGVVVNRCDIGNDELYLFCRQENIPILAEIPHDRRIAESYSRGGLISEELPEYRELFASLWENVLALVMEKGGQPPTARRGTAS